MLQCIDDFVTAVQFLSASNFLIDIQVALDSTITAISRPKKTKLNSEVIAVERVT